MNFVQKQIDLGPKMMRSRTGNIGEVLKQNVSIHAIFQPFHQI